MENFSFVRVCIARCSEALHGHARRLDGWLTVRGHTLQRVSSGLYIQVELTIHGIGGMNWVPIRDPASVRARTLLMFMKQLLALLKEDR